eukprot:9911282-Ditylum_brightwellii.AAC.1
MENTTDTKLSGKRTCFDPTVNNLVAASGAGKDKQSLKAAALVLLNKHIKSLQPSIKDILLKAGTQHVDLQIKLFHLKKQMERMKDDQEEQGIFSSSGRDHPNHQKSTQGSQCKDPSSYNLRS